MRVRKMQDLYRRLFRVHHPQTEKWQVVKDAKAFCAKEGKEMLLQKLDRVNFSATFICR
jgi:hypothetical protein